MSAANIANHSPRSVSSVTAADLGHRNNPCRCRAQRQFAQRGDAVDAHRISQHADVDDAVRLPKHTTRSAEQRGVSRRVAMSWMLKPKPCRVGGSHTEIDGGPGFRQTVERVHNAGDFFNFLFTRGAVCSSHFKSGENN